MAISRIKSKAVRETLANISGGPISILTEYNNSLTRVIFF